MPPDLNITYEGERHEPTEATLLAWEARAYMLEYSSSDPDSEQAITANELVHEKFNEVIRFTWRDLAASTYFRSQGTPQEVEDILQATYTRAFKGLPGFRGDANIETWLEAIMFRQLQTFYTKKAKLNSREATYGVISEEVVQKSLGHTAINPESDLAAHIENNEERDRIMALMGELWPKHRKIILLYDYYGHTHEEIAKIFGFSSQASKNLLNRARKSFREKFPQENPNLKE